jgi:hypothetical protein
MRVAEPGQCSRAEADFAAPTWFAVLLTRVAPEPIIRKLNQTAFATADPPSVQERHGDPRLSMSAYALSGHSPLTRLLQGKAE